MIRLAGTITYRDDRSDEPIEVTQAEYAAFELWAMRNGISATPDKAPPMTMTRYLGYAAVQRREGLERGAWPSYEQWEVNVEDVTLEAPAEGAEAPPIPAVRSAG